MSERTSWIPFFSWPDIGPVERRDLRPVAIWLLVCAGLIYAMAMIGAITRLTESGLSMVEWRPFLDLIPPQTDAAWERVFSLYQSSPEYRFIHFGMTLDQFKNIYFWEWLHRLWGQVIESVFLLPFLWFYLSGRIPRWLLPRLLAFFALGGLQGIVGWLMVQSGIFQAPHVSHYRLALHLVLALIIYSLILTTALRLLGLTGVAKLILPPPRIHWHVRIAFLILGLTIIWGAFVAGLHAGLVYNTFPLMDGGLVPNAIDTLNPWWMNALENTGGVQWLHRLLALASFFTLSFLALRLMGPDFPVVRANRIGRWLLLGVIVQVALGISTLLLQVPVWLGVLHQAGAIFVLTMLLIARIIAE